MEQETLISIAQIGGVFSVCATIFSGLSVYIVKQKDKDQADQWAEINKLKRDGAMLSSVEAVEKRLTKKDDEIEDMLKREVDRLSSDINGLGQRFSNELSGVKDALVRELNLTRDLILKLIDRDKNDNR